MIWIILNQIGFSIRILDWGDELHVSEDLPAGDPSYVKGDANVDARLNVADAVAVLQYITNNSKYPLGDVGIKLADVDGIEGVTGEDAIAIQKIDAITWDESWLI